MKNKYAPYILVPLVVFIWGLIFYRIYQAIQGEDNDLMPPKRALSQAPTDKDSTQNDFNLRLSYDDPFLKENELITLDKFDNFEPQSANDWQTQEIYRPNARVLERPSVAFTPQPTANTAVATFPAVVFQGVQIFENDTVALLKVDGRFYPNVRIGQTWGDLRLTRITRDSVVLATASAQKAFYR